MAALVGRQVELATVLDALDRAAAGEPRLVLLDGEPGSGKTRLVREAVAGRSGARVLEATGDERETGLSFGVVERLAGRLLWPGVPPDRREDPLAVGVRLLRVLGHPEQPTVVVVDDAHWADAPSCQALAAAARRLTTEPVGVLVVTRPDPPPALHPLVRLAEGPAGVHVRLAGLDQDAAARLAADLGRADLTPAQLGALVRHTEGSPLHLTELLRELVPGAFVSSALALPAPRSLASLVRGRLAGLSAPAVRLLAAVAVLGGSVRLVDAAQLAEVTDALAAADEAVAAGLVRRSGPAPALRLSPPHALLTVALLELLPATLLARLHQRAAGAAADEVARLRHLLAASAGTLDPALAERVRARAAALAREGQAARVYPLTAQAADLVVDSQHRSALLLQAAEQALAASEPAAAAALVEQVPERLAPARVAFLRGVLALHQRDHAQARTQLELAWSCADEADEELRCDIAGQLAGLELNAGHGLVCAAWAGRSRPAPHMLFPPEGVAAPGLAIAGRSDDALRVLPPPGRERSGGEVPPDQLGVLAARGIVELFRDDLAGAAQDLRAAAEAARRAGAVFARCYVLSNLAEVEHRLGEWDLALRHAQLGLAAVVNADVRLHLAPAHALAVPVLARRGQWDAAQEHVQAALAAGEQGGDATGRAYAANAAALLAHARGDPQGVLDVTEPLLDLAGDGVHEPGVFTWQELRAEALVRLGRWPVARAELDRVQELAEDRGRRSTLGALAQVRGMLEQARGRRDAARAAYEDSLEHRRAVGLPFDLALGQLAYGTALREWGLVSAAHGHLEQAAAALRRLRAAPSLRLVEQELAQTAAPARWADERLTPQEASVAHLVLSGLRNREIAEELFVSTKTVEFHLRHVYAKLGVTSRSQLVRRLASQGDA